MLDGVPGKQCEMENCVWNGYGGMLSGHTPVRKYKRQGKAKGKSDPQLGYN